MSHQVTVDFEGVAIEIQSQCETAAHSLCKIDKVLDRIHKTASRLENEKVKEYEAYLLESKKTIQSKIDAYIKTLEHYKEMKKQSIDPYYQSRLSEEFNRLNIEIRAQGNDLIRTVNELTGSKLEVVDQMIDDGLLDAGKASAKALLDEAYGIHKISKDIVDKVNSIEDVSLRELAFQELLKDGNSKLSYSEIVAKAQKEYDTLIGKKTEKVIQECKNELQAQGIPTDVIKDVKTIDEANEATNAAIKDEKVRKETLRSIIKAIKDRGFIVDTKKNLKIDRTRNVVKLVALKASGQTAEFEIQINGKFMYRFEGYEGQACNKDITPFMEDLKNVYDINILHEEIQWSNPDKISTQKYQYMKENKNKN